MKKVIVPLVILLCAMVIITGCSSNTTSPTTPAATLPSAATPASTAPAVNNPEAKTPADGGPPAATGSPANPAPAENTRYGGILTIIEPAAPGSPIGVPWETAMATQCMQISIESLLLEQIDGSYTPRLATSYEVNTDPANPSITFYLRKGVKFHDGTDFNAQAVKFCYDKAKSSGYFGGTRYWKSIDVVDDYTINIPLTEWRNSTITAFAQNQGYVVSPTALEKNGIDWLRWNMVGTGPFLHTEFQRDVSVSGTRWDGYYEQGKPYLDEVKYVFVADELTRIALFKSGGADVMNTGSSGRVAAEFQNLGYPIISQLTGLTALIPDSANADSPWANLKVRQAAEYAIDKESIVKAFGYGFKQAAYQHPSPESMAYIPDLEGRKYDVSKAKQLMTEAGYPEGFKTRIIAGPTTNKDIVVAIQSFLSKIGIQVDLEFAEQAKFVEYQNGTWENALLYTSIPQMANFNVTYGFSFASPQAVMRSLKQPDGYPEMYKTTMTSSAVDPALMQKIVRAFYDESTIIPINYESSMWVTKDNLHDSGFGQRGSTMYWDPHNAWLSR